MNSWLEVFFVTGGDLKSRVFAGEITVSIESLGRLQEHRTGYNVCSSGATGIRQANVDGAKSPREHRLLVMKVEH